jgi:hypothetical protein
MNGSISAAAHKTRFIDPPLALSRRAFSSC